MRFRPAVPIAITLIVVVASAAAAQAPPVSARVDAVELPALARQVAVGGTLRLEGVELDDAKKLATFELERFEVFAPDARIVVHGENGESVLPAPDNRYFRGTVAGDVRSSVLVTVLASGGVRGIAAGGGDSWVLAAEPAGLLARRVDATELAAKSGSFTCENDHFDMPEDVSLFDDALGALAGLKPVTGKARELAAKAVGHTARVAVETDYELYQKLGGATAAADYVGDLFAFASSLYGAEIETSLLVSHLSLWSTSADPWTQSSAGCGMMQFGRYWNDNNGTVERTIAHFVSGKSSGSGIAWVGVLCSGSFNYAGGESSGCPDLVPDVDNYGGAYGYTSGIDGDFDLDNPTVLWDIVAVSHEIGHNFASKHTHCYAGIAGNPNPVDECYSGQCGSTGCFCDTPSLPGPTGEGSGTIMSYCHLRSGGYGNLSLTFGTGHPYGNAPGRVPDVMRAHVESRAQAAPACLAYQAGSEVIFLDGFESGTITAWD
jgi:hypothetical protein